MTQKTKTLVFLSGLVPFTNREDRQTVYFQKSPDPLFNRKKNELSKVYGRCVRAAAILKNLVVRHDAKTVIVFDSYITGRLAKLLCLCFPRARKILYCRNRLNDAPRRRVYRVVEELGFELWSYDEQDSREFDMRFNPQVLDRSLFAPFDARRKTEYAAVFLGNTKGRTDLLLAVRGALSAAGLSSLFYIHEYGEIGEDADKDIHREFLPYEEYLELLSRSEAVLDIMNGENWGLSVRPLEAMFMGKKLITNYTDIVHYDFYREENIFVLRGDNAQLIPEWLERPYAPIPEEIVREYDVERWLAHFEER